ncbi:hypothetical protein BKP45_05115 [Anaerobacillus alkalidiazotrophicus]|uniref:Uncharacterized protein n=1 Tax=Anaerobacillus alkalidiazotrophicus TaxID=472963 RepID=A0A1S2MBB7_9BACI|nr:hypothetical protein [Anaerobacillus alkalidiazotrophicus]OIJ22058.1 hypothetical protein BKP45_05115 [Anaerobacillus alkalidiazotrophicus]
MHHFSVVPERYKDKDPRALLYHFPSLPKVKFAKLMAQFTYYKQLEVAEDLANRQGYILLPFVCMHWQRRGQFTPDRKVKIGRNSFFMMKINELTKSEEFKFKDFLYEVHKDKKFIS